MNRWLIYVRERFSLPVHLLLAGGYVVGGFAVTGRPTTMTSTIVATAGILLFLFELRLMDELKDFAKDATGHPKRPLPRGLLGVSEVRRVISVLLLAMIAFGGAAALLVNPLSGILYLAMVAYLFLMYREFFAGAWLGRRPFLYAAVHQVVGGLVALFPVSLLLPGATFTRASLGWSLLTLGGFFGYEICRKLDPKAPHELGYYAEHYGRGRTFLVLFVCLCLGAFGAQLCGALKFTAPSALILLAGYGIMALVPRLFRFVEGLAILNLVMSLYGTLIARLIARR